MIGGTVTRVKVDCTWAVSIRLVPRDGARGLRLGKTWHIEIYISAGNLALRRLGTVYRFTNCAAQIQVRRNDPHFARGDGSRPAEND
jgi:hypothetical protein